MKVHDTCISGSMVRKQRNLGRPPGNAIVSFEKSPDGTQVAFSVGRKLYYSMPQPRRQGDVQLLSRVDRLRAASNRIWDAT
jgi:hypothetical protein